MTAKNARLGTHTKSGVKIDLRFYVYRDGHSNVVYDDEAGKHHNDPLANPLEFVEEMTWLFKELQSQRPPG